MLDFVIKDEVILVRMSYDPMMMATLGVFYTTYFLWPFGLMLLNLNVINQHIEDFKYLFVFKGVLLQISL